MPDKDIGSRIRRARESAGLSQQELAQKLGLSSAASVSYLEAGERRITVADLRNLSEALGRPLDYFLEEKARNSPSQVSWRATAIEPSARKALADFLTFVQKHGSDCPPSRVRHLSNKRSSAAALAILRRAGITGPPVSPRHAANAVGLSVFDWEFVGEISGVFVCFEGKSAIGVNAAHPLVRQRFTMAHELGHFINGKRESLFLDYSGRERGFSFDTDISMTDEVKANQFAANLLMPTQWVRSDAKEHGLDLAYLAQRYLVSEQAMWYRLVNLRLVTE